MPKYTGDGFDKGPFSEDEHASLREMRRDIEDNMIDPKQIHKVLEGWDQGAPIIMFFVNIRGSARGLAAIIGVVSALCVGVVWMFRQGWFS